MIREELEAERREADSDRRARWNWFWWAASLVVFGPFALAAAAVLWVAAFALDVGAKPIWACGDAAPSPTMARTEHRAARLRRPR